MSLLGCEVPNSKNIISRILKKIRDFEKETGKNPIAIIIGPKEYLQLSDAFSRSSLYYSRNQFQFASEFCGFPLKVSSKDGVQFEIDQRDAVIFYTKELRKKPAQANGRRSKNGIYNLA